MSVSRFVLDIPEVLQTLLDELGIRSTSAFASNEDEAWTKLANYLLRLGQGVSQGNLKMSLGGVQATNTLLFSSQVAADTVVLNGVTFTVRAAPTLATEWTLGANDQASMNSFCDMINNPVSPQVGQAKVINTILAQRQYTGTLSAFVNNDTITINSIVLTGKTTVTNPTREFLIGGSDTLTALNMANLINALVLAGEPNFAGIVASSAAAVLTLTSGSTLTFAASAHVTVVNSKCLLTVLVPGQIGNLCTLSIPARGTAGGASFTGGTEGTIVQLAQGR